MNLKEKIIEAAYDLFSENGYDNTSVAQIIKEVGTSKGGFYHHFKSKEDVLETITFSYIETVKSYYQEILDSPELTVQEKFIESYYKLGEFKRQSLTQWPKLEKLYTFKGNHILLKRMGESFQRATDEFYLKLINKGVEEGIFRTKYPNQLAVLWSREVMQFHRSVRHILFNGTGDYMEFYKLLEFNEELINNQLGLEEDKIPIIACGKEYFDEMQKTAIEAGYIKD